MLNDKQLQRHVLDELQWEPSVQAAEIGVAARDGIVTLTGCVPTYHEKVTAERVAKRVRGVKAVANDVEVRPCGMGQRTDTDIAETAIKALLWMTTIPDERIKVSVSKGWLTLEGDVDAYHQKEAAEEAVRPLAGVRGVINQITIKQFTVEPRASAADVKTRIESAFRRSADLDAQRIRVETRDGKVILKGDVSSWAERQEAERTAWAAPGISAVENHLAVVPYVTAYEA